MSAEDLFARLLAAGQVTRANQVAVNSTRTYESYLRVYESTLRERFEMEPYPIIEDKIVAFLMFKKEQGRTFQTLNLFIATFSWYFRQNDADNLVLSVSFKMFKNGLRREMMGGACPGQKLPFQFEFFEKLAGTMDLTCPDERLFFLLMCLSFNFFMRISEIQALKVENLYIDRERNLLACRFEKTKADQFAVGVTSYVPITRDLIDPVQYLDVLEGKNPEDRLCPWKERPLLYRLRSRLAAIGVENTDNYSWHSFRRGAAYLASKNGVAGSGEAQPTSPAKMAWQTASSKNMDDGPVRLISDMLLSKQFARALKFVQH